MYRTCQPRATRAFKTGEYWGTALDTLLVLLLMNRGFVLPVVFGKIPKDIEKTQYRDTVHTVLPPLLLMGVILLLGVWIPAPLHTLLTEAAGMLGGGK